MFDTFIIVDWSAANTPKTGRDSIWICRHDSGGEELRNPPTRRAARALLGDMLAGAAAQGRRVLAGFDFPFGYPAGFAARLGLAGTPWRALWDEIAGLVKDDSANRNNRFEIGAAFNRRVSGGAFPFWGCPTGFASSFLRSDKSDRYAQEGLAEKRLIDEYMRGAQPCWKLCYPGSVGSQVLTGIPVVRALRDDPRWSEQARIWPFETGLCPPNDARIVFAEVWPSWWKARAEFGPPNDKAQVRTVAALFASEDRAGALAGLFSGDPALSDEQRHVIESEEAWTLGVTAPRHPATRKSTNSSSSSRPQPGSTSPLSQTSQAGEMPCRQGPAGAAERWTPAGAGVRREEAAAGLFRALNAEQGIGAPHYAYLRDPDQIRRRSFAMIRKEADLTRFPPELHGLALRLAHAAGDSAILADLAWSPGAVAAGKRALQAGRPVLVDAAMVAAGIARERLPAGNPVLCFIGDPATAAAAARLKTTRSAAAVALWRPRLAGAVVAIGNAPTALFRLLEILGEGGMMPALVLGFPVGFVGAAEAKAALAGFGRGLAYVTLHGRRGGSALAAAAVNALAGSE